MNKQKIESFVRQGCSNPEVFITVNKNRKKQKSCDVYLADGVEFELELFNPLSEHVSASIFLNSKELQSRIILRPGERIFLDCDPNTLKRFKFETYKVSGGNEAVQKAIENNGKIIVTFHKEYIQPITTVTTNTVWFPNYPSINFYHTSPTFASGQITTSGTASFTSSINTANFTSITSKAQKSKDIETGRIEQGSTSNQSFINDYKNFSTYAFHSQEFHVFPESRIPKESLVQYCPCAKHVKIKKAGKNSFWKYCAECGIKL
jgi:hypothetical protein